MPVVQFRYIPTYIPKPKIWNLGSPLLILARRDRSLTGAIRAEVKDSGGNKKQFLCSIPQAVAQYILLHAPSRFNMSFCIGWLVASSFS